MGPGVLVRLVTDAADADTDDGWFATNAPWMFGLAVALIWLGFLCCRFVVCRSMQCCAIAAAVVLLALAVVFLGVLPQLLSW